MPSRSVLVEYWRILGADSPQQRYYAVAATGTPIAEAVVVDLCGVDEADVAIDELLRCTQKGKWSSDAALTVRRLLFDPLPPWVREADRILVVPDGPVALVPFAALPDGRGYLIDRIIFSYVQSGLDLIRIRASTAAAPPMVVGAPAFDIDKSSPTSVWPALQGARAEANMVSRLLKVNPIMGEAATEQALLEAKSPRILHLATHGDFLEARPYVSGPGQERGVWLFANNLGRLAGRPVSYQELRSVVVLAGANDWLSGTDIDERFGRGHVTGEDLARLDLEATELVVLSACSTGAGITSFEHGVVGLRAALNVAGARSLIMTLWEIDDVATQQVMEQLYTAMQDGLTRAGALRQAQLHLRKHRWEPEHWGQFILEGEDGILSI